MRITVINLANEMAESLRARESNFDPCNWAHSICESYELDACTYIDDACLTLFQVLKRASMTFCYEDNRIESLLAAASYLDECIEEKINA